MTFQTLANQWLTERKGHLTESTRTRLGYAVGSLSRSFSFFANGSALVFRRDLLKWEKSRRSALLPGSFNLELNTLKEITAYALGEGLIEVDPAAPIRPQPVSYAALEIPTKEEYHNVIKVLGADEADAVTILACTGLRHGEYLSLTWDDVDFRRGMIVVGRDGRTKGKTSREVPIMPPLAPVLGRRSGKGRVAPVNDLRYPVKRACASLGLPAYHAHHVWRHFFATESLAAGVPVEVLARWLGHKDGGALILKTYITVHEARSKQWATKFSV